MEDLRCLRVLGICCWKFSLSCSLKKRCVVGNELGGHKWVFGSERTTNPCMKSGENSFLTLFVIGGTVAVADDKRVGVRERRNSRFSSLLFVEYKQRTPIEVLWFISLYQRSQSSFNLERQLHWFFFILVPSKTLLGQR